MRLNTPLAILSPILAIVLLGQGCSTPNLAPTEDDGWKTEIIFKDNADGISPEVSNLGSGGITRQARVRWLILGELQTFTLRVESQLESFPCTVPDAAMVDCIPMKDKGVRDPSENLLTKTTTKEEGGAYFHLNEPMNHPQLWNVYYVVYVEFLGGGSYEVALDRQLVQGEK